MKITRGSFLKTCSVLAAGVLVESASLVRWTRFLISRPVLPLEHASAALFKKHLDDRFAVRLPNRRVPLVLARVIEQPASRHFEQFSAIFQGPASEKLADATYRFEHPSLGRFDLFIVAVGLPNAERTSYEACFSRRVKET